MRWKTAVNRAGEEKPSREAASLKELTGCRDAPLREVGERRLADAFSKKLGKARARHACGSGQGFDRPRFFRRIVDGRERAKERRLAQRQKNAGVVFRFWRMNPASNDFNEHKLHQVGGHQ